jgi:hypothetical protein
MGKKGKKPRCSSSGKIQYRTEIDAKLAIAGFAAKGRDEARAYRCPECRKWHTTSKKRRGGKKVAEREKNAVRNAVRKAAERQAERRGGQGD